VIGSIANLIVLIALIKLFKKTKTRVNLLLIHLTIADLLVTIFLMPLEIGWASTVRWLAGDFLCRFFGFFRIFGLFLSSNILICISLDRFYAIVWPLEANAKAARHVKILLWSAWIISILSAVPQIFIFHVMSHPVHTWYTQCVTFGSFPSETVERIYIIFGMVMIYLLPLVVIVITYSVILYTILHKSRNESLGDGMRRTSVVLLSRAFSRTLKMTIVIVSVFILCWTPYFVITVWFVADKRSFSLIDMRVEKFLYIFACANSVMDPIVYGYFNLRKRPPKKAQNLTRDASVKNSLSMAQRPAPYHKLKNCVKFKLKPSSSQDLTKEKDENTYGTFSP